MAEVLAKQPRPAGPRLTIVTNAGGPGVLATDALIAGGGELADAVGRDDRRRSTTSCPPHWSHNNPVDILGDAGPERYAKALEIAAARPEQRRPAGHPHAAGDDRPDADRRGAEAATRRSTASRCWPAGWAAPTSRPGEAILNHAGIPTFAYPDTAARVFNYMWRYSDNLRGAVRDADAAATDSSDVAAPTASGRARSSRRARDAGPHAPDRGRVEAAARRLRHPDRRDARSPPTRRRGGRGRRRRSAIPVVLKLHSETITHKTDVGGVAARTWHDADAVRARLRRDPRRRSPSRPGAAAFPGRDRPADGQAATATS